MYNDWVESRSFASSYRNFTLRIPRRLTKKELLILREVRLCAAIVPGATIDLHARSSAFHAV
jgi:hypothetical protein